MPLPAARSDYFTHSYVSSVFICCWGFAKFLTFFVADMPILDAPDVPINEDTCILDDAE